MLEAIHSLFTLQWVQRPQVHPLPKAIRREYIHTPSGALELLIAESTLAVSSDHPLSTSPPILFIHGGFGHAAVWLPWMTYFSTHYSGRTYAISLRGHGASWAPGYFRMWLGTNLDGLISDLIRAITEIERLENGRHAVLVGHSSGGGLIQYALGCSRVKARAIALVGAIPHFGSAGVYWNWFKNDPWFLLRSWVHLQHPRSPLSSTGLVGRAFFGAEMQQNRDRVEEFARWMPNFESMRWAVALMKRDWVSVKDVLAGIEMQKDTVDSVLVMGGDEDKLVRLDIVKRVVDEYRHGVVRQGKRAGEPIRSSSKTVEEESADGARFVIVKGAGHHLQNDLQADDAAEALRRFVEQV